MSLKLVSVLVCAAVLGIAQTGLSSSAALLLALPEAQSSTPPGSIPAGSVPGAQGSNAAQEQGQQKSGTPANSAPVKGKKGKDDGVPQPLTNVEEARTTYVIGPLDILQVKVWQNPNLSGFVDVRADGMVSLPLVGEVKANGLSVQQFKTDLAKRIADAGQINPDVDVQVVRANSKKFYVTGGVKKGGEFPLPEPITVLDALSLSGGFTEFANLKKIFVLRNGHQFFFNYKEAIKGKNPKQNIVVQNGDHIVVPE